MHLLELPREIRDLILIALLEIGDERVPSVLDVRKWNTLTDRNDPTATKVLSCSLPAPTHALSHLCRVNRQCFEETKAVITHSQRTDPNKATLKLDLLLDDVTTYYASWLRILPFASQRVGTVHMQIRPFFALRYTRDLIFTSAMAPQASAVACQAAMWRLGAVINGLLNRGPTLMGSSDPKHQAKDFTIERLEVEIVPPRFEDNMTDENDIECVRISVQQAIDFEMHIRHHVETMFSNRQGGVSHVPWGYLMLSRVRKLVIVSKGRVLDEFDVAAHAKRLGVALYPFQ